MALSNYGELKTAIATLLNRSDLTAAIPDFISMCDASLNRKHKGPQPAHGGTDLADG
jgi:hypothetical protein